MSKIASAVLILSLVLVPAPSSAQSINFDGTGAPCIFQKTLPLTTYYQSLGVTFGGNGAILNECALFGVDALSGSSYWALNTVAYGNGIATINFTQPVYSFSIWVASGFQPGGFVLTAFDGGGGLAGSSFMVTDENEWGQLRVTSGEGIDRILIGSSDYAYVLDDLEMSTIPEPSTVVLLGTGLLGIGLVAWRRRKEEEE